MQPNQQWPEEQKDAEEITPQQYDAAPIPTPTLITESEPVAPQGSSKNRKKLILFSVLITVIILVAGVIYWQYAPGQKSASVTQKQDIVKQQKVLPPDPMLATFIASTTGEKWLASPKKITKSLGYFADGTEECTQTTYYEVGSRGDNTIILASVPGCIGGSISYLFERAKDGKVSYISQPISNGDYTKDWTGQPVTYDPPELPKSITVNKTIHYDSLSAPKGLTFGSGQVVDVRLNSPDIGELITNVRVEGIKESTVQVYGLSKLQKIERRYVDTKLTAINYVLNLPTGTQKSVTYTPIPKDLSTYTWNNGVTVKKGDPSTDQSSEINGVVRGCGAVSNSVSRVDDAKDSDFVLAGKAPSGQAVYTFKDIKNPVVQAVYKDYKTVVEGWSKPVSLEEFMKQHAIVAFKDRDGSWLVYSRDKYALIGGCGKPVVYLYPTKTQNVNVRVGADVSVSVPEYNPNTGWNAVAQPSGLLTVNGKPFDSLFWEGTGHGLYPGITAGTVVKYANAAATMRDHLQKQGLNSKEANDFLAFWQPRIPNSKYVRITWLTAAQINQLAPLNISPKPDTMIRVFIDMAGYDSPVNIPSQKLGSQERKGFTVVEWGGLLSGMASVQ